MRDTRDDFETITESRPLVDELRARIERDGPITFREFMDAALYHPRYGYYRTPESAAGRGGDYVTSPQVHPIFGALVAKQILEIWRVMSCPDAFTLVEQGAGDALLARDVLRWAEEHEPDLARAMRYVIVEPDEGARRRQAATIEGAAPANAVTWVDELPGEIEGVLLSNELIDAFPVHRVVRRGGELLEVFVALDAGGRFVDELRPPSTPALGRYFDELGLQSGDGCYAEVNLDAAAWMERVAASMRRGVVLTFDYGYEAADLYAPWRRDGTLLCFYRQSASSDPYQRIGRQDMTASVDFTTLRRAGERAGLRTDGVTTQADFLVRLGIGDGIAAAAEGTQIEEYFARRRIVMDLIDPGRLGRITVLAQSKGLSALQLRGFENTPIGEGRMAPNRPP